jgi:YlmC/YmxH family sporulation protein
MLKVSELRVKDIINIVDGKRFGFVKDIELDLPGGKVKSLVLPGSGRFLGFFGKKEDIVISWDQIKKVGIDVILVEINGFTDVKHNVKPEEKLE